MNTTINTSKPSFRVVNVPEVSFTRTIEGDSYPETVPAAVIQVPFANSKGDAIDKALDLHRSKWEIPRTVTIMPTVASIPLVVGTTVPSASGTARWKGRTIKG
jgi:hypothetical protein